MTTTSAPLPTGCILADVGSFDGTGSKNVSILLASANWYEPLTEHLCDMLASLRLTTNSVQSSRGYGAELAAWRYSNTTSNCGPRRALFCCAGRHTYQRNTPG